jgi:hypothetical protein
MARFRDARHAADTNEPRRYSSATWRRIRRQDPREPARFSTPAALVFDDVFNYDNSAFHLTLLPRPIVAGKVLCDAPAPMVC